MADELMVVKGALQASASGTSAAAAADGGAAALQLAGGLIDTTDMLYEDDATDNTIPDIQKITRKNNIMPLWMNQQTMNLNALLLENVVSSSYYKNYLPEVTTFPQVIEEIYYNVQHLEPWERGTRKTTGMTGMCGGVRGVGAGGVVSTAFCLLYKLFTLRLTRKQLVNMINHTDSPYIRGLGFMYIRFCLMPQNFWQWMEPYLDDDEEVDPRSGGGDPMLMGQIVKMMLTKLDWYGTLFPRIPIPIQKDIDAKFQARARKKAAEERHKAGEEEVDRDRRARERSTERSSRDRRSRSRGRDRGRGDRHGSASRDRRRGSLERDRESGGRKKKHRGFYKCKHHQIHHHCKKHKRHCPSKAKRRGRKDDEEQSSSSQKRRR